MTEAAAALLVSASVWRDVGTAVAITCSAEMLNGEALVGELHQREGCFWGICTCLTVMRRKRRQALFPRGVISGGWRTVSQWGR